MNPAVLHYAIVAVSAASAVLAYLPYGWAHVASGAVAAGLSVIVGTVTVTNQSQARSAAKKAANTLQ